MCIQKHVQSQSQRKFRMSKCLSTFQCWLVMMSLHWWPGTLWQPAREEDLCKTTLCRCSRVDGCWKMWAPLRVACHPDLCNEAWPWETVRADCEGQVTLVSQPWYWKSTYVNYISSYHCMLDTCDLWTLSLRCSRTQTTVPHTLYRTALTLTYLATHCSHLQAMLWM